MMSDTSSDKSLPAGPHAQSGTGAPAVADDGQRAALSKADAELEHEPQAEATTVLTAKADPAYFALRGQPPRAIRFRRQMIAGTAGVTIMALAVVAWFALKPAWTRITSRVDERVMTASSPPEAVTGLSETYANVPKLGPALPGDLGRPILARQRKATGERTSAGPRDMPPAQATQDRDAFDIQTVRQSGLMANTGRDSAPPAPVGEGSLLPPMLAQEGVAQVAVDPDRDPNAQQRKLDFLNAGSGSAAVSAHRLADPPSSNLLSAGSIIAASLITGVRSDLPGFVTAQVTERIYDSATGKILLIPQGARLIGSYDSVIAFGQRRALIAWQRLIMPNGSSIQLDNVPATDAAGYAGLEDRVDFHSWQLLKGVAISTLLGLGTQLSIAGESDLVEAIRQSTQQSASRAGDQLASRNLNVQPTITIRPGSAVRLIVHKDIILAPWRG